MLTMLLKIDIVLLPIATSNHCQSYHPRPPSQTELHKGAIVAMGCGGLICIDCIRAVWIGIECVFFVSVVARCALAVFFGVLSDKR